MHSANRGRARIFVVVALLLAVLAALVDWALRDPAPPESPPEAPTPAPVVVKPSVRKPVERRPRGPAEPVKEIVAPVAEEIPAPAAKAVALRRAVKVQVLVRRSIGGPASGAEVLALDPLGERTDPPGPAVRARKTAGEDGRVTFDVLGGTTLLRFAASLDGEAAVSESMDLKLIADGTDVPTVELDLSAGVTPRVRALDPDGTPVAGAAVRLQRLYVRETWALVLTATTDADGVATFPALPKLDWVWSAEIVVRAEGRVPAAEIVPKARLDAEVIDFVVPRAATVRGRAVDEAGAPVVRAGVRIVGQGVIETSGADGAFVITALPPDGGVLVVEHIGFAPSVVENLPGGTDSDVGDVILRPGRTLRGKVTDSAGEPLAGVDVTVTDPRSQSTVTSATDAEGAFTFEDLADAGHELLAKERPQGRQWGAGREARLADVRPVDDFVPIVLTGGLSVVVRFLNDADRTPVVVASVKLTARATGDTPEQFAWAWSGRDLDTVRFQPDHEGTFDVTVEIPGYESGTAPAVEVAPDRETRIDVLFRKR